MPSYDYKCQNCNGIEEYFEPYEAVSKKHTCKNCKGEMKRMISSPNFAFKSLPKGHNLGAKERRQLWNSDDPKDFKKLM